MQMLRKRQRVAQETLVRERGASQDGMKAELQNRLQQRSRAHSCSLCKSSSWKLTSCQGIRLPGSHGGMRSASMDKKACHGRLLAAQ
jgi:hypothetical protein